MVVYVFPFPNGFVKLIIVYKIIFMIVEINCFDYFYYTCWMLLFSYFLIGDFSKTMWQAIFDYEVHCAINNFLIHFNLWYVNSASLTCKRSMKRWSVIVNNSERQNQKHILIFLMQLWNILNLWFVFFFCKCELHPFEFCIQARVL